MKDKMIYINGRFLSQRMTGVQRFALDIVRELKANNVAFKILIPKGSIVPKDLSNEVIELSFLSSHFWEQITLPFWLFLKKATLLNLCNLAPLLHKRNLIIIHDLAYFVNPKWFSKSFASYYRTIIPLLAKTSKHIFTVSNTVKNEIITTLNISSQKISTLYNKPTTSITLKNRKDNLPLPYILTVGSLDPRKNLSAVIQLFEACAKSNEDINLVIVGGKNNIFKQHNTSENSRIIYSGYVDDNRLSELYTNASLFINLSKYEGFGIPNIEALQCKTPILVSDIPVFREIVNNAAYFWDGNNIDDALKLIDEILLDRDAQEIKLEQGQNIIQQLNSLNRAIIITKAI